VLRLMLALTHKISDTAAIDPHRAEDIAAYDESASPKTNASITSE